MLSLGEEQIKKILKDVGLTEKETHLYIFLAKHGALKGIEIAKQTRIDKAEVYRILKSLQNKGLLELSLEAPARFVTVPFDKVIDSFVKTRRNEAAIVERKKKQLLNDWRKISKTPFEQTAEKFVVLEGDSKIYPRIFKLIKETKNQLSAISTVPGLLRADQLGLFDALVEHPSRSKIQFQLLTELSEKETKPVKNLLKRISKKGLNFQGKSPDLGLQLSPRMIIRDDEEILFFITQSKEKVSNADDTCLWTNCKALVQSFIRVFTDLWDNSTELETKIIEIESGKPTPKTYVIKDAETARSAYDKATEAAEKEIVIMTSSQGLSNFSKSLPKLNGKPKNGIKVRIMAPILGENVKTALELSEYCEVRHVTASYLTTTVVDGKYLFQFRNPSQGTKLSEQSQLYENTFYTSDIEYLKKTKTMLDDVWKNALPPSAATAQSIENTAKENDLPKDGRFNEYKKSLNITHVSYDQLKEKDIINKIIEAKKQAPRKAFSKHIDTFYGSTAIAVIRPPEYLNLPRMIIQVGRFEKQSSFGGHDEISISSWLDTGNGFAYVPVALICDNPRLWAHRKQLCASEPVAQNVQLVRKQELQIGVHGNTLFAGWTVPIRLFPPPTILPPCCILFEGYGELKTKVMETRQVGRKQIFESNTYEAFVTFFHPSSKYSGPGTDGLLSKDMIVTTYPLQSGK